MQIFDKCGRFYAEFANLSLTVFGWQNRSKPA